MYLLLSAVQQLQDLPSQMSNLQWQVQQNQGAPDSPAQQQIEQLRSELQIAQDRIAAMETSKFWQIRTNWFKVKKTLGLPTNE